MLGVAAAARAQVNPPVPAPSGPLNPPGAPQTAPAPGITATPLPCAPVAAVTPTSASQSPLPLADGPTPATPAGFPSAAASATPAPCLAPSPAVAPAPTPIPTPVPIIVDPASPAIVLGKTVALRVTGVAGTIVAVSANPAIAGAVADQNTRTLVVTGNAIGTTTITLHDDRGIVTRDVPVRVAYAAGTVADETSLRVTGNPAGIQFLKHATAEAAAAAATLRSGASVNADFNQVRVRAPLGSDDKGVVEVPVHIAGPGYIDVDGVTRVELENFALPSIAPAELLVSDYPERLTASGVLFTADLDRSSARRFLYYHYNAGNEPARRVLLKASNSSNAPAMVQIIAGSAGPGGNEMEIGHLTTERFLVREYQNEGTVITIPPQTTVNLVDAPLPPGTLVSALLQLREVSGDPIHLALVAQDLGAPLDQSTDTTQLLSGGAMHARGSYSVPEFFFDYTYTTDGDNLEIPIGQLPLPNLRAGEALGGDYGVQQSITVTIVNPTRGPMPVAIYANPRGGRATGTFLIDRTLVQAHALPPFSKYKIWQETIRAGTFRRVQIVTMPEGGSSYPLRLIFAPDDGSVPPGAPGSPIY